jgi:6-phosphogluconolactonase
LSVTLLERDIRAERCRAPATFLIFVFVKFLQELRMLKKAAALFLVCASVATWVSCGSTSSRYLYASIPGSNEIVAYREDPNSGVLTQLAGSPITAGQAVQAIVIHPSKKFLYAANSGEGDVSLFTISTTGILTEVTPRTSITPDGTAPTLLAMDAAGAFLYVGNAGSNNISVFSIDSSTGALTQVGNAFPIGTDPLNMQVSPSGNVLYVTGGGGLPGTGFIEAFTISQGVATPVPNSPFPTGTNPDGLAIASSGSFLYTANKLDNSISEFAINADGSLTALSGSPIGEQFAGPLALSIDKSGTYLYVANQASTNLAAYSIGSDGTLTLLTNSPFGTGTNPSVIATDSGGKYLFVGNQPGSGAAIESFSLASSTGTLTTVATYSLPGNPTSIAITP